MKLFISTLLFALCALSSIAVCAQTVSVEPQLTPRVCNQELFERAEDSFNRRRYNSELSGTVERELKEVIANCSDYSWRYQAEEYLKIVQEESAEHHFLIARYYWDKYQSENTKSLSGVISRLKEITEKYPNYSQIILVKQLLGEENEENEENP